jgi:hypothetical protein
MSNALSAFAEALRKESSLAALCVGYDDGASLLRIIRDVTRAALKRRPAPPSSAGIGRTQAVRLP